MKRASSFHPIADWLLATTPAAAALVALLTLAAVPAHAAGVRLNEATDVVSVEVPVQVVKDGAPVRGLTADDFEVYDGRKKQTLTGFEVIDAAAGAAAPSAGTTAQGPTIAGRRHFLLLFDLAFSEPKSIVKAREAARDLVEKRLLPSDLVAVATYSSKGAHLVVNFTPDRVQVARAIDTLGVPELVDRNPDPVRLYTAELRDEVAAAPPGRGGMLAELLARLEEINHFSEVSDRHAQQGRATAFTRSFAEFGHLLASVSGRKQVLLLSEGFASSLLLGTADAGEADEFRRATETVGENLTRLDSDKMFGSTKNVSELGRLIGELQRADCVVQAIDIGGLRGYQPVETGGFHGGQGTGAVRPPGDDTLFQIADGTGGDLYRNFNDLGDAMAQMLARTSLTYVLAFQPEGLPSDGSYRPLRVVLKHPPAGVRVVARPGYYAPRPFTKLDANERMMATADTILGGRPGGAFAVAVLPLPLRPAVGETRAPVPVALEIDGPGLEGGMTAGFLPAEVFAYALDDKGGLADFFSQTLMLDLAKVGAGLARGGLKFLGRLDLPPGAYTLRVLVRNARTGQSSLQQAEFAVQPTGSEANDLLPPLFLETQGRWLLARQAATSARPDRPYPFRSGDQTYLPVALPAAAPGEPVALALAGYDLGQGEQATAARLQGADGKDVAAGELRQVGREPGGGAGPDRLLLTWTAPPLPAGEYRLTLTVSATPGRERSTTTPVRSTTRP
ncbi:MAG TPA: VWA domain-containing protein, partial [Thermoanaerobaculia bacterium]